MDSIFEVLVVILFILFNLVASWLQKKKKEQNSETGEVDDVQVEEQPVRKQKTIEEILFGTSQKAEVPKPSQRVDDEFKPSLYSDEKMKKAEEIIKRQKKKVEEIHQVKKRIVKNSLKEKIKNTENLKDYIVINEILNKPKYFDY